jgi:stage III sporulation protein AH
MDFNMMVLKKKEIIAGALVLLIGVAGYLNWSYQDVIHVTDGESYAEETSKRLGEAQYVSSTQTDVEETAADTAAEETADYFVTAKSDKEAARSKAAEILKQTAENESFDADIRKKAQEQMLVSAQNVEKENTIESIARAKGYNEISVYIDGENVDIIARKDGFSDSDVMILKDIAAEQLKISSKNIKVVEIK